VPKVKKNSTPASATSANVGYEAQLWQIQRLVEQLQEQQKKAAKLDAAIAVNLKDIGYGG